MESNKYNHITLKELALQRKVSVAIIFGGAFLMSALMAVVGLFLKQDTDLIMLVLASATVLSILPSVLRLIKLNALLRSKTAEVAYSRS